jgi:hypothetical protein
MLHKRWEIIEVTNELTDIQKAAFGIFVEKHPWASKFILIELPHDYPDWETFLLGEQMMNVSTRQAKVNYYSKAKICLCNGVDMI